MRKWPTFNPEKYQPEAEEVIIPDGANFFDLYHLCFKHGKDAVLAGMGRRYALSLKTNHVGGYKQLDAIFKIRRMGIPEMVQACQNGPPEYHVSGIASQAWVLQEMLKDNGDDEKTQEAQPGAREHHSTDLDI